MINYELDARTSSLALFISSQRVLLFSNYTGSHLLFIFRHLVFRVDIML